MEQYLIFFCTDMNETGPSLVIFQGVDQFYVLLFWRVYSRIYLFFIGYRPEFSCTEDPVNQSLSNESLNIWKTYESCNIKTHTNDSGGIVTTETACIHGYTYSIPKDRTFVTEVCIQ